MWIKDKSVYGINITRTNNGHKAVFDRTLSDEQIMERLAKVMGDSRILTAIGQRMEKGQPFRHAVHAYSEEWTMELDEWTNDKAVAYLLAGHLEEKTGIGFGVEWSELNADCDEATGPDGNDLVRRGEMDIEYFVYVKPSMPWDEHVYRSEDDIRDMLLKAVQPFVYGHVHWPAEAQIGTLDCWYED